MNKKKPIPPRLAELILKLFTITEERQFLIGDFEEIYFRLAAESGVFYARLWYWFQTLITVLPFFKRFIYWNFTMLGNYLKTTFKNLMRYKVYSLINIFGLALGLASGMLILMYIQYELSYDRFHENADRVFSVNYQDPGRFFLGNDKFAVTPLPLAPALMRDFPDVEAATRIKNNGNAPVKYNNELFLNGCWFWSDKNIFEVFTLPFLYGSPETALSLPNSVVLTNSIARTIFGNDDPIGKTIRYKNEMDFTVTGIIKDIPSNSHFSCSYIANITSYGQYEFDMDNWEDSSYHTYLLLKKGVDQENVEEKLNVLIDTYKNEVEQTRYYLTALKDIHLRSDSQFHLAPVSDIRYVYIFSSIAFLVLLIACFNYINLSTARSLNRAKEVSIRKVAGAYRWQLIHQFILESFILTGISFVAASFGVYMLLPEFYKFVGKEIPFSFISSGSIVASYLLTGIIVSIFSGLYPALVISGFQPAAVLKGSFSKSNKGIISRNILAVFQFSISIFLIAGTLIIVQQIDFIRNKNIGINREQIIYFKMIDPAVAKNVDVVISSLQDYPAIVNIARSMQLPINISSRSSLKYIKDKNIINLPAYHVSVDDNFLDVFGIELKDGRNFSRDMITDNINAVILNETSVQKLGLEYPIGAYVNFKGKDRIIVGVVRDFNYTSFHQPIDGMILRFEPEGTRFVSVKISANNIPATIEFIKNIWDKHSSGYPFVYHFVDEEYERMYQTEMRISSIFKTFAAFTIIISCLGLFGLASFSTQQSIKEIGIRKVLGAGVPDIVIMLSWKYTKWVFLASVFALPAGYFTMNRWLEDFAYRISPDISTMLSAAFIGLTVAVAAVSVQTIKAAYRNPADSIRCE